LKEQIRESKRNSDYLRESIRSATELTWDPIKNGIALIEEVDEAHRVHLGSFAYNLVRMDRSANNIAGNWR